MDIWDIRVHWSPGYMGIIGNEVADRQADLEAHDPHEPSHLAAEPTVRTTDRHEEAELWCTRVVVGRPETEAFDVVKEMGTPLQYDPSTRTHS